jgi:hypothetical protein
MSVGAMKDLKTSEEKLILVADGLGNKMIHPSLKKRE